MPKICYNKWHKPETEETLCPDPKNADASVPCPDAAASAPWRGQRTAGWRWRWRSTRPSASSTCWAAPRRSAPPRWGWPAPRCSRCTTPPGAGWPRPWWRGGACTSPAETMCSAPGERSVPAGTAPGGIAVWDAVAAARACGPRKIRRL